MVREFPEMAASEAKRIASVIQEEAGRGGKGFHGSSNWEGGTTKKMAAAQQARLLKLVDKAGEHCGKGPN